MNAFANIALLLCVTFATEARTLAQSQTAARPAATPAANAATLPPADLVYGTTRYLDQLRSLGGFVVADINGDGILDLVSAQDGIGIALGDVSHPGSFLDPFFIKTPDPNGSVLSVGDLNGDGLLDIVYIAYGNLGQVNATILFQDQKHPGSFLPPVAVGPSGEYGLMAAKPLIADMNQDGVPDLVLVMYSDNSGPNSIGLTLPLEYVSVLLGDPLHPGSFLTPTVTPLAGNDLRVAAITDMNGDGFPDVVIGDYFDKDVLILLNDPAHPSILLPPHSYPAGGTVYDLAVGDMNRDHRPDIVVGGLDSGVGVLLNNPALPGTLSPPVTYPLTTIPANLRSLGVAIGDVNGDGIPDVAAGSLDANMNVLLGNGDGTLAPGTLYPTGPTPDTFAATSLAIADVDGDGLQDVLVGQLYQNSIQIFLHRPSAIPLAITATDMKLSSDVFYYGGTLTLSIRVSAFEGIPQGSVTLYDSGSGTDQPRVVILPLDTMGRAVYTTPPLHQIHYLVAHFQGDSFYAPSTSLSYNVPALKPTESMTLSGVPNPANVAQNVVLTATLSPVKAAYPTPTGTVTFLDGSTPLGSAPVSSTGAAVFNTSTLTAGIHNLKAAYSGDGNYDPQTATLTEVVLPAVDFTLATGGTLTLGSVRHGAAALTATPLYGLADTIALSCGSLPLYVTCRMVPSTVTLSNGTPQQASIQIALDQYPGSGLKPTARLLFTAAIPLLCLALPFRWRNRLRLTAWLLAVSFLPTLAGCGYSKSPLSTPPGTYTIILNGHGTSSNLDRSTTLILVVQ